ncbi:hypothetical protein DL98DRAFT_512955 [Cadophora sp. DSE1049]|nr:hypothetical protein DL98DRAFT_512955 [Cadophora sp. DSE1049]
MEILGELGVLYMNGGKRVGVWTEDMRHFNFAIVEEVEIEKAHERAGLGKYMVRNFLAKAEARGACYAYATPKQSAVCSVRNRSKVWNAAAHVENVASEAVFNFFTDRWDLDGSERLTGLRMRWIKSIRLIY